MTKISENLPLTGTGTDILRRKGCKAGCGYAILGKKPGRRP